MIAGMRPKGEKARAIKVTVFKRWQDSSRIELRPGVSLFGPPQTQLATAEVMLQHKSWIFVRQQSVQAVSDGSVTIQAVA